MPTRSERQALAFFGIVTVLGVGVRVLGSDPPPLPSVRERLALESQIAATDSAAGVAAGKEAKRKSTAVPALRRRRSDSTASAIASPQPFAARTYGSLDSAHPSPEHEPGPGPARPAAVNPDQATAAELEALPWVGPALAARIVADREAHGPFGSVEGLVRVRGVGPKLAERLRPLVTFGGPARPRNAAPGGAVTRAGERLWVPAGHPPRP
ncbi:MAG: ComEA family DNA-binding protein [Gemmatimonadaceae bacterium]